MQAKTTERTMRELFDRLQARGETEAAAGVYLAAKALFLVGPAWRPISPTVAAAYRLSHPTEVAVS
jgi:hypothetical protein